MAHIRKSTKGFQDNINIKYATVADMSHIFSEKKSKLKTSSKSIIEASQQVSTEITNNNTIQSTPTFFDPEVVAHIKKSTESLNPDARLNLKLKSKTLFKKFLIKAPQQVSKKITNNNTIQSTPTFLDPEVVAHIKKSTESLNPDARINLNLKLKSKTLFKNFLIKAPQQVSTKITNNNTIQSTPTFLDPEVVAHIKKSTESVKKTKTNIFLRTPIHIPNGIPKLLSPEISSVDNIQLADTFSDTEYKLTKPTNMESKFLFVDGIDLLRIVAKRRKVNFVVPHDDDGNLLPNA
jgi:hypothetical protein